MLFAVQRRVERATLFVGFTPLTSPVYAWHASISPNAFASATLRYAKYSSSCTKFESSSRIHCFMHSSCNAKVPVVMAV